VPNSVFSQFLLDAKAAADDVTGLVAAQNIIGHWEADDAAQEFWADVAKNGFYLFIEPPAGKADFVRLNSVFQVKVKMIYSFASDETTTFIPIMNMVAALIDAWKNFAPWAEGKNRSPVSVDWEKPKMLFHEKPYIGITEFTLHGAFVIGQAADPCLVPTP
jgi:hypothetical protein